MAFQVQTSLSSQRTCWGLLSAHLQYQMWFVWGMLTSPLSTCNSVPIIDQRCEITGVREVVTAENREVLMERVSQYAISGNQCDLWFHSLTHLLQRLPLQPWSGTAQSGCSAAAAGRCSAVVLPRLHTTFSFCKPVHHRDFLEGSPLLRWHFCTQAARLFRAHSWWVLSASFYSRQPFLALIYTILGSAHKL